MADFTALKNSIRNYIKQNGNAEITGEVLQNILISMVVSMGDGAINGIADGLTNEANARTNADGLLQNAIDSISTALGDGYTYAGIATSGTTPASGRVFYLALQAGTYTNFGGIVVTQGINILKNNNGTWQLDNVIGIDDVPTAGSPKLVKSGGVFTNIGAFDISDYNKSGTTLATYADLTAALAALPSEYQKGGMSVKFVQSSDNKYVQARLMADSFTTDVTQWQGVDNEPTAGSDNLVESDGVKRCIENVNKNIVITDIYTSTTDNFLDIENVIELYGYDVTNRKFIDNLTGCIMSRPIYVGDAPKIYISGYNQADEERYVIFLSEAKYNDSAYIDLYVLTNTSRLVDVPEDAKYCVVILRLNKTKGDHYSNMKLSKTESVATQTYNGKYLGNAGQEYLFGKQIATNDGVEEYVGNFVDDNLIISSSTDNALDTSVSPCGYRITDDSPYFVENPNAIISNPIYVRGTKFTWKSNMNSPSRRWIAFCSDKSKTAESVISVVDPGFAINSSAEQIKTVDIPSGAKYIFVTLKVEGASDTSYLNDTLAFGTVPTYDEYKEVIIGFNDIPIGEEKKGTKYDFIKDVESSNVLQRYIPYSVGTPTENLSVEDQYNRINLLYFTDSHIDLINPAESLQNVVDTVQFARACPISLDAVLHGGDVITPFGLKSKSSQKTNIARFFDECKKLSTPVIFSVGNHDTNDWGNLYADSFDDADWSEIWYDWAEENYGIVRQTKASSEKSTWHYYDIASKKIRIVCLDVQDVDKTLVNESGKVIYYGGVAWYISNEQFNWVASTALNFDDKDEKDWGVIILSHQDTKYGFGLRNPNNFGTISEWVSGTSYVVGNLVKYQGTDYRCKTSNNDANFDISKWDGLVPEKDIDKFALMLQAFNTQSTYQENYLFPSVPFYGLSINADFTRYANIEKRPFIIAWIVGHEHFDFNNTVNGINIICTLNGSATTSSSDARVARIVGTSSQNAFDLISIDRRERKIRYVRYGAGKNCYGEGGDRFLPDGLSF